MQPYPWAASLFLAVALLTVTADGAAVGQDREPPGFLEVKEIAAGRGKDGGPAFNMNRPYAIWMNRHVPEVKEGRKRLIAKLHDSKKLDQFVFTWFGTST